MRVFSVLLVALLHNAALRECYGSGNSVSTCPSMCVCTLDVSGRRQTTCDSGRMTLAIPASSLNPETEVLVITAPENEYNVLTIGPIFQSLKKLEELTISRSQVPAIGEHSFWGLKHLQKLDLTHNSIRQITDKNFRGLVELRSLHLDHNHIDSMPSNTFKHMVELRALTLSHNNIKELVPRVFLLLNKLHHLDLSYNPLGELYPEVFKDIMDLRELRCRSCGLTNINDHLYSLIPSLEVLDLSQNQFKYLRTDEFVELRRLRELNLSGNQLPVILDKTFGASTPNLKFLSLSRNRIAKITNNAFVNATNLQTLDVSYNKLSSLEAVSFEPIGEPLRTLNLSGNHIEQENLKVVLQAVLKLRELYLSNMSLTTLPLGVFVFHEHIRLLNLSYNQFQHFPAQLLSPLTKLKELDLSNNKFRGLNDRLVDRLEHSEDGQGAGGEVMAVKARGSEGIMVRLKGNPWQCDQCHIGPILAWISRFAKQEGREEIDCDLDSNHIECLRCASPRAVAGMTLSSLDTGSLDWCNHGTSGDYTSDQSLVAGFLPRMGLLAALGATALAVLLILIVIIFLALSHSRHAAHYYTREDDRIPGTSAENEAIFSNPDRLSEDIGKYATMLSTGKLTTKSNGKVSFVTIATIDEITKDPELQRTPLKNGVGS
ncbi:platelet glycoprotein V-like [Neocloeon triangulifer]|uniref:platelet glycoprotein V-like n=1 Tax=Neocloeon triangulifer TaxID=2078957 RepID=UPI00286EDD43|nr:platelet glycoprotein V-like [Neocloeon triangulifer]